MWGSRRTGGSADHRRRAVAMSVALALIAAGISLVPTSATVEPARAAVAASSSFYFESDPGDGIAQGRTGLATADDSTFGSFDNGGSWPAIGVSGPLGWWVIYAIGPGGEQLESGRTYPINGLNQAGPSEATLDPGWSGESNCASFVKEGTLTVHDVAYDGTNFARLSISFDVRCDGSTGRFVGELRFNTADPAYDAVLQSPTDRSVGAFGARAVGSTSGTRTITLTNAGAGSLGIGTAELSGSDSGDFVVVVDGCSGITVAVGGACSFDIRFEPSATGDRSATLSFPVGTVLGHRRIALSGKGVTPSTTTLDTIPALVFGPFTVTGNVSPAPSSVGGFIPALGFEVDGNLNGTAPIQDDGSATTELNLPPGTYQIAAAYGGNEDVAASRSDPQTVEVGVMTGTTLSSSLNPALSTQTVTLTASVAATTPGTVSGGTLSIADTTAGQTLGSLDVGPGATTLVLSTTMAVGAHDLRADYSGHGSIQASASPVLVQSVVLDQAVDADGFAVAPSTFYPVKDGYRDVLRIGGRLHEPAVVTVRIYSVATGRRVRKVDLGSKSGQYVWSWNGRTASGTLVAAGKYRVVQTIVDTGGNTLTTTAYANLSKKKLYWTTVTKTQYGSQYVVYGDPGDGWVRKGSSSYTKGVRISSGHAWAAVSYAFGVPTAVAYRNVTFKVLGRSPNGRRADIAIWAPARGSYLNVDSYDAVKVIGPSYRWYSTTASLTSHRGGGKVRAVVFVGYNGSVSNFDIAKVAVTYTYGVLK